MLLVTGHVGPATGDPGVAAQAEQGASHPLVTRDVSVWSLKLYKVRAFNLLNKKFVVILIRAQDWLAIDVVEDSVQTTNFPPKEAVT